MKNQALKYSGYIDKKLVLLMIYFYTSFSLVSLLKVGYLKVNGMEYSNRTWSSILKFHLLDFFVVISVMTLLTIIIRYVIIKRVKFLYVILLHIFLSFMMGLLILIGLSLLHNLFGMDYYSDFSIQGILTYIIRYIDVTFPIYFCLTGVIYIYYYLNEVKEAKLKEEIIKNQLNDSRISALQSQLQPHFFFNTLNTISGLIEVNRKEAQNTIGDFGELLRMILDLSKKRFILLEKEIELMDRYIKIVTVRFSDHIEFRKEIDSDINSLLVPSLLLQPIVENCVKHGYSKNHLNLNILIKITRCSGKIKIIVENNGKPMSGNFDKVLTKGMGLRNIKERLDSLYAGNYQFELSNRTALKGVRYKLLLPIS
ncbi:hypothetical protein GTQ34_14435 [Muricauda sp. JGD-17]|uniref:Signal transduction histidine kinase internal region domain-containing protein n=1 Tax=Flagellimonas ochracea TaxID=2696472 RepID=A0A964WYP4_9FLAO|nr:histidine kinase [Allomuricauda ochracea]NAY93112.1 hypothetical protein [Allomuricauda ochracea]